MSKERALQAHTRAHGHTHGLTPNTVTCFSVCPLLRGKHTSKISGLEIINTMPCILTTTQKTPEFCRHLSMFWFLQGAYKSLKCLHPNWSAQRHLARFLVRILVGLGRFYVNFACSPFISEGLILVSLLLLYYYWRHFLALHTVSTVLLVCWWMNWSLFTLVCVLCSSDEALQS